MLAITDVVDDTRRDELWPERRPLFGFYGAGNGVEIVVRIGCREGDFLGHAFDLEETVCGKTVIEFQEAGIVIAPNRLETYGIKHPKALHTVKEILLHGLGVEKHLFDHHMAYGRVLDQLQLLPVI